MDKEIGAGGETRKRRGMEHREMFLSGASLPSQKKCLPLTAVRQSRALEAKLMGQRNICSRLESVYSMAGGCCPAALSLGNGPLMTGGHGERVWRQDGEWQSV